MGVISNLASIDRKFSWSFFGFLLAIVFGSLAVYSEFFKSNAPVINYEIFYNEGIIDVKEDLGKLDIVYDGIDIRKTKQTLRAVVVGVSNTGNQSLLKSFYDANEPLGINFDKGEIIKSEVMHASDEYLKKNVNAKAEGSVVKFSPVILDGNQFFVFKFLLLHKDGVVPEIQPLGKIAGVPEINLVDRINKEEEQGFWSQVIDGSLLVIITRLPLYFFGFVFSLVFVFAPIAVILFLIESYRKKGTIKKYKAHISRDLIENEEKLFDLYENYNSEFLVELIDALSDQDKLSVLMEKANSSKSKEPREGRSMPEHMVNVSEYRASPSKIIKTLKELGLIDEEGIINRNLLDRLKEFSNFVAIKNA